MAKKSSTKTARSAKKSTTKKKSPQKKSTRKKAVTKKKVTKKKVVKKKVAKKKIVKKKVVKKKTTKTTPKKKTTKKKSAKAGMLTSAPKPSVNDRIAEKAILKKSYLKKDELEHYRNLLLIRRAEILSDITTMSTEALRADASNLSNMPLHMADVGSDYYEQELTLGLVESERRMIQEINEALSRIADGTYGICDKTGKRINKSRLNAKPWAKYCIEAAREVERTQAYNNHR